MSKINDNPDYDNLISSRIWIFTQKIVNIQRYLHKLTIFSAKIQMSFLRFFGAAEAI